VTGALFSLLERLHGHLAVLGLAVLVHPLLSLRLRPGLSPRTRLSAELAALLLGLSYAAGWLLYPSYRQQVKPPLRLHAMDLLLRFETKEHLALMTLALALGGAVVLRAAGASPEGRRAAWWLLAAALVCGLCTGGLGMLVAAGGAPAF